MFPLTRPSIPSVTDGLLTIPHKYFVLVQPKGHLKFILKSPQETKHFTFISIRIFRTQRLQNKDRDNRE